MLVTELIIGIDLGSTCIKGAIGKKVQGGTELLAISQVPVVSGIRRGVIHNVEEVSKGVVELIDILLKKTGKTGKVENVYIGVNGYSIRTIDVTSSTVLSGDEILNEIHLDSLSDDVETNVPESLETIDIFPQEFIVDGKVDVNPVGSMPTRVEAHYKVVAGKPMIFKNLDTCFKRINLRYEQVLGPLASAEAILEAEEKNKGVVAVDFGAQTTSVCIFKGNVLRYMAVLPFGGLNITNDLMQLNIDLEDAEKLKIDKGIARHYSEFESIEDLEIEAPSLSDFEKESNEIIVARTEEIVENIYAQLRFSGAEIQKLTAGIVITGGASVLPELDILLSKKTGMPVRKSNPLQNIFSNPDGIEVEPGDALSIGLLLLGKADCCVEAAPQVRIVEKPETVTDQTFGGFDEPEIIKKEKPAPEPKKEKPKKEKTTSRLSGLFKSIFDDDDL